MDEKIGLFTGSFDPVTLGHLDLIRRASRLFDRLIVGIFDNPHKVGYLSIDRREALLREVLSGFNNLEVIVSRDQLVVEVARQHGVTALVRGLRTSTDLDYEASLDFYNHQLDPEIETVYLMPPPELKYVSSSGVRELLKFGADISPYVPSQVKLELEKIREKTQ